MRRLLIGLAAGLLAMVSADGAGSLAQEGTPTTFIIPTPELCTLEPVSFERLEELLGTPEAGAPTSSDELAADEASPTPFVMPEGEPVDDATREAVQESMLINVACLNTGDPLRTLAIYTDARIVTLLGDTSASLEEIYSQLSTPEALSEADWTYIVEFGEMVRLPDGRVAAVIVGDDPREADPAGPTLFTLAEVNGHWYIDEFDQLDD